MRAWAAHVACVALTLVVAGCSSAPKELERVRAEQNEDRLHAAADLAEGLSAGREPYVSYREEVLRALRTLLDDRSALVRQGAIDNLARVQGRAAAAAIADRLRDRDPWVRYTAARRLGEIEAQIAAPALVEALRRDESEDVRRAAAQALGRIRADMAVRDLYLAFSEDASAGVRYFAHAALVEITGHDLGEDPKKWRAAIERGRGP